MQDHYWEDAVGYDVKISKGFTELKPQRAYTQFAGESPIDYRQSPSDKSNMSRYLFTGFKRSLYPEEKFHSDSERRLAVILERESKKWFKPARGQFQIYYKWGAEHPEYQPDFVAETDDAIYMMEPKAKGEMDAPEVKAKMEVAVMWCKRASHYAISYGGKAWKYVLIPHDAIAENMTISGLAEKFSVERES